MRLWNSIKCSTIALLVVTPTTTLSSELLALKDTVNEDTEMSYQYVRCASFYNATMAWAGQQLDNETRESMETAVSSLLQTTVFVRTSTNPDGVETISEIVLEEANMISELYLDQFRRNYAVEGTAWDGNEIWENDLKFCQPVAQAANALVSEEEDTQ